MSSSRLAITWRKPALSTVSRRSVSASMMLTPPKQPREMETERDQLGARDVARARRRRSLDALEREQVEPEALEPELQVDRVDGVEVARRDAPVGVDRAVGKERHRRLGASGR
jgi:hypothetical protein